MRKPGKIPQHISDKAYTSLPDWERMLIDRQVARLMIIPRVGPGVAREVLAHLGVLMEETNDCTEDCPGCLAILNVGSDCPLDVRSRVQIRE